jgi:hypothetical protein
MRLRHVVLLAVTSALWIFGLVEQMHSREAAMRYLVLSLALVAVAVWRWRPRRRLKPHEQERPKPWWKQ